VETLVGEQTQLEDDLLWVAEPMKRITHVGCHRSAAWQLKYESSSSVKDRLQLSHLSGWKASKEAIAVV